MIKLKACSEGRKKIFFISIMVHKWCFGADTRWFAPQSSSSCEPLGRRRRGSLLFNMGRLSSAKSACAALLIPCHSPVLFDSQGSKNSLICGISWKCGKSQSEAVSPGSSYRRCGESLKGKLSKDGEGDRKRKSLNSWELQSQSCSNIEGKGPGQAGFAVRSVIMCHGRRTEESSRLSPWRKHVSLLERPELINKWWLVSSSLSHRGKSCLDLFQKTVPSAFSLLVPCSLKQDAFIGFCGLFSKFPVSLASPSCDSIAIHSNRHKTSERGDRGF